jgi:hypothetical protein
MANMGRPPVPNERKRLLGNPGKRALPKQDEIVVLEGVADQEIPEPPRQLFEPGRALWDRAWSLGNRWISPVSDIELLVTTCEQVDERIRLRTAVWNNNRSDERRALRELERQIVNNLSLLGFTPTDRTRMGLAEVKAKSIAQEIIDKRLAK